MIKICINKKIGTVRITSTDTHYIKQAFTFGYYFRQPLFRVNRKFQM